MWESYPNNFKALGINRTINRRNKPSRKDRMINLLYNCNKSLSSSVKNNKAKQIHIPKMKNQNKSYFALNMNAFIHVCCSNVAKIKKNSAVIINIAINWIMNFD
jgi:hypothetical protein